MSAPIFCKCPCQRCSQKIEFDAANLTAENRVVPCPHCGLDTLLFIPEFQPEQTNRPTVVRNAKQQSNWESEKTRRKGQVISKIGVAIVVAGLLVVAYAPLHKSLDEASAKSLESVMSSEQHEAFGKVLAGKETMDAYMSEKHEDEQWLKDVKTAVKPRFHIILIWGCGVIVGGLVVICAAQLWLFRAGQERLAEVAVRTK